MKPVIEQRSFAVELRAVRGEGKPPVLKGYASVFGVLSDDMGGWRETVERGAFAESIKKDDIRALWNHNWDFPLARKSAGNLVLTEDEHGLAIEITPADTQWGRDAVTSIERGDVSQMSIGFVALTDEWKRIDGEYVRVLQKAELWEVSPVIFPAFPQTEIGLNARGGLVVPARLAELRAADAKQAQEAASAIASEQSYRDRHLLLNERAFGSAR